MDDPLQRPRLVEMSQFYEDARVGGPPQVSWVIPSGDVSEHHPPTIRDGMAHVTSIVNAVMQSPLWPSWGIFISWDDWGGFYDHVPPPNVDRSCALTRQPGEPCGHSDDAPQPVPGERHVASGRGTAAAVEPCNPWGR